MRTRSRAAAFALLGLGAVLTGCSAPQSPHGDASPTHAAPSPTAPTTGVVLTRGTDRQVPWALDANHDKAGRLCMALVTGSEGGVLSSTCGLPEAAGAGYRLVAVPGPGGGHYYFATVPATATRVRLSFHGAPAVVVPTSPVPGALADKASFFITRAPQGAVGVATATPLDAAGNAAH